MQKLFNQSLLLIFLIFNISFAQESTGSLEGKILDRETNPIINANIFLSSNSLQGTRGTSTNALGNFCVYKIPPGNYRVKISYVGKQTIIFEEVLVQLGKKTSLGEVILNEALGELPEVIVSSNKNVIDPTSTTNGLNLNEKVFENLPIQRDYKSLISLSPLATESYYGDGVNVSGGTGWENTYYIDGTNVTDPMRGTSGTNLPYNFIKEIEIKNGGYEAEYAGAMGGIANVITYSGGNQFHGQVFSFFSDQSFAGKYKLGTVKKRIKDFSTYDFGISFGGPLILDKLWYFVAYNPSFQDQDVEIPDVGIYKDRTQSHRFAGKLTWQFSPKTNLQFALIGDPTKQNRVENQLGVAVPSITSAANAETFLGDITTGGFNLSLKVQHIISDDLFVEASTAWSQTNFNDVASSEYGRIEPFYMDFIDLFNSNFYAEGGYGRLRENLSRRVSASVIGTYFLYSHILKMGLAYEDSFVDDRTENKGGINGELPNPIMRYPYPPSPTGVIYQGWWAEKNVRVHNRIPSIFLQDSWMAIDRLRINAGIRWNAQFLIGSDAKIAQEILDQWQPRIGIIYQPGELGTQKIFGSFGRFYQQLPLILTSTYASNSVSKKIRFFQDPRETAEPFWSDTITTKTYQPKIEDLEGQYFDEFTLGYERRILDKFRIGIRGTYRKLGQVVEDGTEVFEDRSENTLLGNPGSGNLDFLPKFTREYSALEITFQKPRGKINFLASYVLSRNYGNYPGVFDSDIIYPAPNLNNLNLPEQLVNATGLLPNDRTHVFKVFGTYIMDFGLAIGTSFILQTGTPLNSYSSVPNDGSNIVFLAKRGSQGRTPAIWDLNFRLSYDLGSYSKIFDRFNLILDILHLFSQRDAVLLQQHKYVLDMGGGYLLDNPTYLDPEVNQSPTTIKLGIEVNL